MSASILIPDFIGVCLLLAEGNIDESLENMILAAEEFEERHNRHFGTSQGDFRALFFFFNYNLNKIESFRNVTLRELIPPLLSFQIAHFNDEGAALFGSDIDSSGDLYELLDVKYWNGYSREEFSRKIGTKAAMREYFRGKTDKPESIKIWMKIQGINDDLLYHCSRPGASS